MRKLIVLTAIAVTMLGHSTAQAASKVEAVRNSIDGLIENTWYMQRVMDTHKTQTTRSYRKTNSVPYILWVKRHWKKIQHETRVQFQNPPHYDALICIHGYEGSWTDGGSPYYGGLQMNLGFQGTYGGWLLRLKGTADNWTPLEQIWVAEKAIQSRGFWPWPNTARYCGLV